MRAILGKRAAPVTDVGCQENTVLGLTAIGMLPKKAKNGTCLCLDFHGHLNALPVSVNYGYERHRLRMSSLWRQARRAVPHANREGQSGIPCQAETGGPRSGTPSRGRERSRCWYRRGDLGKNWLRRLGSGSKSGHARSFQAAIPSEHATLSLATQRNLSDNRSLPPVAGPRQAPQWCLMGCK